MLDMKPGVGISNVLMQMNLRLAELLSDWPNTYVLNSDKWLANSGKYSFNPKLWYMAKTPFGNDLLQQAVKDIKSAIRGLTGHSKKLIALDPVAAGRRGRRVKLTAAGERELALLDRLSDDAAADLLGPLSDRERENLLVAMAAVERLLLAGAVRLEVGGRSYGPAEKHDIPLKPDRYTVKITSDAVFLADSRQVAVESNGRAELEVLVAALQARVRPEAEIEPRRDANRLQSVRVVVDRGGGPDVRAEERAQQALGRARVRGIALLVAGDEQADRAREAFSFRAQEGVGHAAPLAAQHGQKIPLGVQLGGIAELGHQRAAQQVHAHPGPERALGLARIGDPAQARTSLGGPLYFILVASRSRAALAQAVGVRSAVQPRHTGGVDARQPQPSPRGGVQRRGFCSWESTYDEQGAIVFRCHAEASVPCR